MATQPTQNQVPSESPRDLKYNAGKIDEFTTSMDLLYQDRLGSQHYTIEGIRWLVQQSIAQYGYITVDSFQAGSSITLPNQVLRDTSSGEYYRWDGMLPKVVPENSTPQSSGGVGKGAWLLVGEASLRADLRKGSGAELIGFGSSTIDKSLVKDVRWFGAKGDGVTDDSAAIQAAANTGSLYFTPGNYLVTKEITINTTKDCVISGSSRADTSITYSGNGTLFTAKFSNSIRFVQVSDIRILSSTLATATAFYFEWPEDFEHGLVQRGSFFNVSIRGVDEYENGFNSCVHMHQGDNVNFINCEFKGAGGSTTVTQAYNTRCAIGVNITGRYSPVEYRFSDCYFGSFYQGIKVEDTAEGIYVSNCILLNVRHAIYWVTGLWSPNWPDNPGSSAAGRPFLSIHNSHLSFYEYGVYTSGVICIHETDILTYHHQSSTQNGISFAHGNATEVSIVGCESWGFNTTYYVDAIDFYENVTYSKVRDLRFVAAANNSARYAVQLRPGCTNNDIYGVLRRKSGGTFVNSVTINDLPGGLNNIGIRGGLFYATATQSVSSGLSTVVNYGARDYDPDNLWPGSGGNITIPAGVSRIRISGAILLDTATTASTRELFFLNNGSSSRGMGQQSVTSVVGKGTYMNITSAVILVTPGDIITMNVRHDDGQTRALQANLTWMQIEIIA